MAVVLHNEAVEKLELQWRDRKRTIFGLPWSFTVYSLDKEALHIKKGFFNLVEDDVKLYRIMDVTLKRSFGQRIFGLGTLHCCSSDKTLQDFDIRNIKHSNEVKTLLSQLVEEQRDAKRVSTREFMSGSDHIDDDDDQEVR